MEGSTITSGRNMEQQSGQSQTWLQHIKKHRVFYATITLLIFSIALIVVIILGYLLNWDAAGFNGGINQITTTTNSQRVITSVATVNPPRKTLWDWLQLLIAPAVVSIAGLWFTRILQQRDKRLERAQRERDQQLAEQRAERERVAAEQQSELERELTRDNQREAALQAYLDRISELLIDKDLSKSKIDETVRNIARVKTLTVLRRLDASRKESVFQFLYESGLFSIIDLSKADLGKANLSGADLSKATLSRANLSEAKLSESNLSGSNLSGADLREANLVSADLSSANLSEANLSKAILSSANLSEADLSEADLSEANLSGAILRETCLLGSHLSKANLRGANLRGAIVNKASLSETDLSEVDLSGIVYSDVQMKTILSIDNVIQ